jgi:hypothetical protein
MEKSPMARPAAESRVRGGLIISVMFIPGKRSNRKGRKGTQRIAYDGFPSRIFASFAVN